MRKRIALLLITIALPNAPNARGADPLPSWKDGPSKKAILDFVAKIPK